MPATVEEDDESCSYIKVMLKRELRLQFDLIDEALQPPTPHKELEAKTLEEMLIIIPHLFSSFPSFRHSSLLMEKYQNPLRPITGHKENYIK